MKDSAWFAERNQELLKQVDNLRVHAEADDSAWSVSLDILQDEIGKALEGQIAALRAVEERIGSVESSTDFMMKKVLADADAARGVLDETIKQLQSRIGEMEKLREEDAYQVKKDLTFKEAEINRLMGLLKLDPAAKRRRLIFRAAAGLLLLLGVAIASWMHAKQNYLWEKRVHPLPYGHPSAVAIVADQLVVCDWMTQSLYYHGLSQDLRLSRVVFAPKFQLSGLAGDERRLYGADRWERKLWTLTLSGTELEPIRASTSPGNKPGGLYLSPESLWATDSEAKKVYRLNPERTEEVIKEYPLGDLAPRAMFRRGDRLWILDEVTGRVYRSRPKADLDKPESWDAMTPAFPPDGARPVGLTSDPQSLWILTSNPTQLIRYNFRYLER